MNLIQNKKESVSKPLINRMRNAFWMAPMSGTTDTCFRQLMDEMGAGVLISELVSAKGLLHNSGKTKSMIHIHSPRKTIVGIQLFGESADDLVEATSVVEGIGADFVDINLGCPVKKVVKKGCGSALLRDPIKLEKYLSRIKNQIRLPLTVKMRTGWDHKELTIKECVRVAENIGCEWVAIHGRTRAQGYNGLANWKLIGEVKEYSRIPIVGNGDIRSADQAWKRLEISGVDAVMIGRGALRNPWIFEECNRKLEPNHVPDRIGLILRYLEILRSFHDDRHVLILIRKFIVWLSYSLPGSGNFRGRLFQLCTIHEVVDLAAVFFERVKCFRIPHFRTTENFMMGGHG